MHDAYSIYQRERGRREGQRSKARKSQILFLHACFVALETKLIAISPMFSTARPMNNMDVDSRPAKLGKMQRH